MLGDEAAVVAVTGDAVVGSGRTAACVVVYVTPGGPAELLGAVEARNAAQRDRSIGCLRGRTFVRGS